MKVDIDIEYTHYNLIIKQSRTKKVKLYRRAPKSRAPKLIKRMSSLDLNEFEKQLQRAPEMPDATFEELESREDVQGLDELGLDLGTFTYSERR